MKRFWNFMLDELAIGVLHYDELDPAHPIDWVLESGWYDCQMGSALLIALCRVRGIPARMASGYFLYPASPTPHYWVEVWLDHGWLDVAGHDLRGSLGPWTRRTVAQLFLRMPRLSHEDAMPAARVQPQPGNAIPPRVAYAGQRRPRTASMSAFSPTTLAGSSIATASRCSEVRPRRDVSRPYAPLIVNAVPL